MSSTPLLLFARGLSPSLCDLGSTRSYCVAIRPVPTDTQRWSLLAMREDGAASGLVNVRCSRRPCSAKARIVGTMCRAVRPQANSSPSHSRVMPLRVIIMPIRLVIHKCPLPMECRYSGAPGRPAPESGPEVENTPVEMPLPTTTTMTHRIHPWEPGSQHNHGRPSRVERWEAQVRHLTSGTQVL